MIKEKLKQFRTKLARIIDPEYAKLDTFANCMITVSKQLEAELNQDRSNRTTALAELGKYKANFHLLKEGLEQKLPITLTLSGPIHSHKSWFPGQCTIENFYWVLTGQELPHKDLK